MEERVNYNAMNTYIIFFDQITKKAQPRVGGKCASLGKMIQADIPVPPGFAVTTDAYSAHLASGTLKADLRTVLDALDPEDVSSEATASETIRALIEQSVMSPEIETAIRDAYNDLCDRVGVQDLPVAVRSSATAEDLPDASFAGQQDTYLWVVGADAVVEHVQKCWSSLYTPRAISYRQDKGFGDDTVLMSVAVQKMVNAKTAGVAMTLNPLNGDRSKIVIDASWGLGETVVAGTITPDNFVVDKIMLEPVSEKIAIKQIQMVPDIANRSVSLQAVEPSLHTLPSLTRDELLGVCQMAKRIEKFYGAPQDIEWAIDADLPAEQCVVVLQSRPETVWSRKKPAKKPKTSYMTGMAGILNTLYKPMKTGFKKKEGS